ncbi:F0F1 ATP synthase subunit B [Sphingomonas sp. KRR8]|uniref:F0F1 ATP synthase subunit B family protein n=1 Tax=Sphingomonas sp. KRR8 TaxID=2942996 RepID=UPI002022290D|nr:F0F1 ATP synthase subunit B [Sphingomonas sp. KRR8]URD61232.1 F0F1 ATP synthase subunit B [Sphingomonas sp. KRR8]
MADPVTQKTHIEVEAGAEHHVDPSALGFDATMLVGLAMLVVILLMLWKKVPAAIGKSLDTKIAAIRAQLDEAAELRKEAEALKAEYQARFAAADQESAAMLKRARHEADAIRTKAEADAAQLVERRTRMAEDKIAAEERAALQQLRATAADAAAKAAARIIAERHDGSADKAIIDQAIAGLGR